VSKATEDFLAGLHGELARAMQKKLKSGDFTASDLNVIRQFLKDNGINADGEKDPAIRDLADELPDDIDNVIPLYGG
jgi:hypothetical protein